jgi:Leucine-rich repeat (LRR) protein
MAEELEVLNLTDNQIEYKQSNPFYCLKNLRRLYLKNNNISSIPRGLFQNNSNLVVLDLSDNNIQTLDTDIFQHHYLLSYVIIEGNPASYLSEFSSTPLPKTLNVIDVGSCKNSVLSVISYQRIPVLDYKQNSIMVTDLLPDNITHSDQAVIRDVILSKLRVLEYNELDYLYYNSTLNVTTTYSAMPVFCYCNRLSVWFWCFEMLSCGNLTVMYDVLQCNKIPELRTIEERKASGQSESRSVLHILVLTSVVLVMVAQFSVEREI